MSEVDDGYGAAPAGQRRGGGPREMRSRLREQDKELAFLRARVAELEAGPGAAEPEQVPTGADEPAVEGNDTAEQVEAEPVTAEQVEAERAARHAAEVEAGLLRAGITPEVRSAAALDRAASEGAQPPTEGLEGMYQRLQDRSVPWPQLQREMAALGFRDHAEVSSWDPSKR